MKRKIVCKLIMLCAIGFTMLSTGNPVWAQTSLLTCNTPEQMNPPTHASMSQTNSGGSALTYATVGGVINAGNAISASTTDYASIGQVLLSLGSKWLQITDGAVPAATGYPAGTFAGFEISNTALVGVTLLGDLTISTYLNGTLQESISGSSLLVSADLLSSGSRGIVGFTTTMAFNAVRITSSGVSLLANETRVYNAVLEKYCAGPSLSCNTSSTLTKPDYPLSIINERTGIGGAVCLGCSLANTDRVINNSLSDFATITLTGGVLSNASIAVADNMTTYPAGTFAGFDIESTSLLTAGVLSNLQLITYNNGTATGDTVSGTDLVLSGSSILSGTGRQVVGFITTQPFDELRFIASNTGSISLGTINVYGLVLESFCTSPAAQCNVLDTMHNTDDPIYVNGINTGVNTLLCVACAINNSQNAIDTDLTNYAEVVLTAAVATSATFSVANALDTYTAGTFAGFDLELDTGLSLSVLSTATIRLYNNGSLVQTGSATNLLLGLTTTGLSGTVRQTLGLVATVAFDEVQISFNQVLGADLGTIRIYGMVTEHTCTPALYCNSSYYLKSSVFAAVIDMSRTGVSGIVSTLASVQDVWNVVSADTTDYATITNTASVAAVSSIAVYDPTLTFPKGTFAGFVVRMPTAPLVLLDLFNAITINTYNDGVLQESQSGANLINLTALATLIGSPSSGTAYNVGFVTTKHFDEIQIAVSSLASVGLLGGGGLTGSTIDIFGAFIDTRSADKNSSAITCWQTNPDINVTFVGMSVDGNARTNDWLSPNALYGTPVASGANPTTDLPVMNTDGTYSFLSNTAGIYRFTVPVCPPADSVYPCPTELLTITILDSISTATNVPIANTDIAATGYNTPVVIKTLRNDAAGTPSAALVPSSIVITDLNGASAGNSIKGGTASFSTSSGDITYTPATNFIGTDTVEYTVFDNQTVPMSSSAYQLITVWAPDAANTTSAADDYKHTIQGTPISGNVMDNDIDPEGNSLSATADTVTSSDYTIVLNTDGSYTFTPAASLVGPVSFVYEVCDDASSPTCATATAYFLVAPLSFPLPITLADFKAKVEDCRVNISWESGSENGLFNYRLEHSQNGEDWRTIARIEPYGDAAQYQFVHQPAAGGEQFYKLQLEYGEGQLKSSAVQRVSLNCGGQKQLMVFPNPAREQCTLRLGTMENNVHYTYELQDLMGRLILHGTIISQDTLIDIRGLVPGTYQLKCFEDGRLEQLEKLQILR